MLPKPPQDVTTMSDAPNQRIERLAVQQISTLSSEVRWFSDAADAQQIVLDRTLAQMHRDGRSVSALARAAGLSRSASYAALRRADERLARVKVLTVAYREDDGIDGDVSS